MCKPRQRIITNTRQNEAKAYMHEAEGGRTTHVEWIGDDIKGTTCQPQSMIIWEGIELIGCPRGTGNKRCGVVQGVVYHVTHFADSKVYLEMNPEYQKQTEQEPFRYLSSI